MKSRGKGSLLARLSFDAEWYNAKFPDVRYTGLSPEEHFLKYGMAMGRAPNSGQRTTTSAARRLKQTLSDSEKGAHTERREIRLKCADGGQLVLDPWPGFSEPGFLDAANVYTSGPALMIPLRGSCVLDGEAADFTIAIHLSLHRKGLLDIYLEYLLNLPAGFSVFVSVEEEGALVEVKRMLDRRLQSQSLKVQAIEGRGEGLKSLLENFGPALLQHDLFAHMDSRSGRPNPTTDDWRRQLLHNLFGSLNFVTEVVQLFAHNRQLGMVFPEYHWSLRDQISWGEDFYVYRELATALGMTISRDRMHLYPAGSMFWARTSALGQLLGDGQSVSRVADKLARIDEAPFNRVERLLGEMTVKAGYALQQIKADRAHNMMRYFTVNYPYQRSEDTAYYQSMVRNYRKLAGARRNRIAVFTAVTGAYDSLLLHEYLDPTIDYFVFTDSRVNDLGFWKVRPMDYWHPDSVRMARYVKIHPRKYFPDYEVVVWIDANVLICGDIEPFLASVKSDHDSPILGIPHPLRNCVYREGQYLIEVGVDRKDRIERQLEYYRSMRFPQHCGMIETNCLIYDMQCPRIDDVCAAWWGQIVQFSHRDQLSVNYALWNANCSWVPLFGSGRSLRDHPLFGYFGHGQHSGLPPYEISLLGEWFDPFQLARSVVPIKTSSRKGITLDVVVCIHNALDDVMKCLVSVTNSSWRGGRIILVDDASDRETESYLEDFASTQKNVVLLRNSSAAKGYCKSANMGIAKTTSEYVLLLNSDAILPKKGIEKLLGAAVVRPTIGLVGPLSNAASFQSIPEIEGTAGQTAVNSLPQGASVDDIDEWCAAQNGGLICPNVPLVHGFCQLIKREVFDSIGLFDEARFPDGYGEENDFCLRAEETGYELIIAVNCFVFHAKSASYRDARKREKLMKVGGEELRQKHSADRLQQAIEIMKYNPILRRVRAAATESYKE